MNQSTNVVILREENFLFRCGFGQQHPIAWVRGSLRGMDHVMTGAP
jgi:hypothetical protein